MLLVILIMKISFKNSNIRLSKTQLHKIGQSRGFLFKLCVLLLKNGLSLIGNVLKPLSNILLPIRLKAAASGTDEVVIRKHSNLVLQQIWF